MLQWIAWIVVIGFAAVLPWLVHDWMLKDGSEPSAAPSAVDGETVAATETAAEPATPDSEPEPAADSSEEPVAAAPKRSASTRVSDFFRQAWLDVKGVKDENRTGDMHSERSREAAARVTPALEAALAKKKLALGMPIFLRIFKESNELELWMEPNTGADWVLFKTWPICEWSGELGPKLEEGDGQSPEGFYYVPPGRMNPESQFHLSFDLGFPNEYDRKHKRTGSYLMVHGNCVSVGCYAMTDPVIEEIYTLATAALDHGQPYFRVHAFPFRMTDEHMDTIPEDAEWFDFWANLKEGYDYFEFLHRPPEVTVVDDRYHFR